MSDGFQKHQDNKGKKMAKMRQGLWRNVLRFLVKVSHIDLNEELLKENEYLKAEIDVYRKQLEQLGKRPRFTDGMRRRLVGKALALGRRMRDVVTIVRPDTILRWQRRMVAALYDSSGSGRRARGRPAIGEGIVEAVVRMAEENPVLMGLINGRNIKERNDLQRNAPPPRGDPKPPRTKPRAPTRENTFHHIVAVDDGPDDRQAFKVKWRRVERPKAFAVFSEKRACLPMGEVAFPINLTCQNRQDLNNWLVKDLCPMHKGESMDGAEKISTFVHCAIQNGLR